jgi:hypothetical protein
MKDTHTPHTRAPWSTHAGYDLSRYTAPGEVINDLDRHHPGTVSATVVAEKFTAHPNAHVRMSLDAGPADMHSRMSSASARTLAQALLAAADIVEAFEVDQRIQADETELARYNAGPIARIELPGGVVAFESATEGGAA